MTTDDDDEHRQKALLNTKLSISSNNHDDHTSISSQDEQQSDEEFSQKESLNTTTGSSLLSVENGNLDFFFPLENSERSYLCECPCQSHLATQLINRTYPIPVKQLFHWIFDENDFLVAFRSARRIKGLFNLLLLSPSNPFIP